MASRGCSLVRLRPLPSAASFRTRALRLPNFAYRPVLSPPFRATPIFPFPRPILFSTTSRARRRPDPREDPKVDYDQALGDPWYHHRLRTAQPLTRHTARSLLRSPRTHTIAALSVLAAVLFYWSNLEVVPVSGRKRFNCYSEHTVRELSGMQYKHLLYELERQGVRLLPARDARVRMVQRVMARLVPVAGPAKGDNDDDEEEAWEIFVIDNDHLSAANAFVLPGGKVFVYSGLLRVARTDGQLAAVLSHEIAHNLAKHVSERLSGSVGESIFLGGLLMALAATPFTFVVGYLFGGQALDLLFSRPMGRMQESEADYIGLMMMAEACYDPKEAIVLWERMHQVYQQLGMEPPEFLSTHPSNQHRIERITKWLPEALKKSEESDCKGTQGFAEMFKRAMDRREVFISGM